MKYTIEKGQVTIPIEELNRVEQDIVDREVEIAKKMVYIEDIKHQIEIHKSKLELLIKQDASIVITRTITKHLYFSDESESTKMAITDVAKWDVKNLKEDVMRQTKQRIHQMPLIKLLIWRLRK